ncbi:class I SAM-dependent methyltransferase, partial [bacterium]|nr:class I SAM-dependent methyltransferase [bacterium]
MFNPFKKLGSAALEMARTASAHRRMTREEHIRLGDLLLHTKPARWKSEALEKGLGVDASQAEKVVDWVFYDGRAKKELSRVLDGRGGVFSAPFWDTYLRRSENAVLGFSDGYAELLKLVSSSLPEQGLITDWKCGTGTLAASLWLAAPNRLITAIDPNPRAVVATRRLSKSFFPDNNPLMVKAGDPTNLRIHPAAGAVLMNGLFLLDTEAKVQMLSLIHERLDVGAPLLLVEPKPTLSRQSALRLWIHRVVKSAC